MNQTLLTLLLGFFLGIKHAFDADHIIAVSTMVTEHQNPFKASLIGTFWGVGHTTTLFITGILVLLLKINIPERLSLFLEMIVGFMLVFLGIRTLLTRQLFFHTHIHTHHQKQHKHPHFHLNYNHWHKHYKSFLIGTIHGLAGSGALMILILSTIRNILSGIYYILLFGIGSIVGMTLISFIIGIPFHYSTKKIPSVEKYLKIITGMVSIIFGILMIYEIGFVEGLIVKL